MSIDCVLPAAARLGECPLWSAADECLYWIDIEGRRVHRYDPATGIDESRDTVGRPGSLAATGERGRLLLATEHAVGWFDWGSGSFAPWRELEPAGTRNRLNDGRCDPAGRFWVGSMWERPDERRFTGMLHCVEPTGKVTTACREIGVSNGLAFSPDGTTMYFADSLRRTVWAYDYDVSAGSAENERVFTDFTDLPGTPDGACVDEDGGYWIACIDGWAVARLTPDGTVDRVVEIPVERPTMPAFGGPGLDTLFVTSIAAGGPPGDQPCAGGLLALDVGTRGIPEPGFAG
ncbi:MAG: SMP-30/gluconolactonase/LRE family protein [Actinobacteria bacterium]|nr:SMP-30/gluconolactonase/LRE family protein [Actinomycetota bacterium]NIS35396.1 SMP-30/gluconolactonase/LRE family protein [Actinomycetota bacterium]NIT98114.1 SMP-30/gluconolactonase/LRE family protein [Actinomycetota bacterium]NIU70089.1 SMP-30/gluconolactonase/LRE family protein [Actinomycetota bacterium]NIV58274.1 SMP-30/gluconolactonase/LRE family protein [Actinomycetota bacterium]